MGKSRVRNIVCAPPSSRQGKTFYTLPHCKGWKTVVPLTPVWLKLKALVLKTPLKLLCPPFRMAKTFPATPPFYVGSLSFCSPHPTPVIDDQHR